jgi:hypothetical protein
VRRHTSLKPTLLDRFLTWLHADERRQAYLALGFLVSLWLLGAIVVGDDPSL